MQVKGKIHSIGDTVNVTDTFTKRDLILEYTDNPLYPQYVKFELTQERTKIIDDFQQGDDVEVTFNLRGREWISPQNEKKYFNTLDAWRVQKIEQTAQPEPVVAGDGTMDPEGPDDLPF